MKVRFVSTAIVPGPSRLVDRQGFWRRTEFPVRVALVEHPREGIVLVDTGYSQALFETRTTRLAIYRALLRPRLLPDGDLLGVLAAMGASAADVRHIVVSHLHADHVCGLDRFPAARIHASRETLTLWNAAASRADLHMGLFRELLLRAGDRPQSTLENASPVPLPWGGSGFDVFADGSLVALDLPGHMRGHCGVFFPTLERPLLYAVDAAWTMKQLRAGLPPAFLGRFILDDVPAWQRSAAAARRAIDAGIEVALCHEPSPDAPA